MASIDNAKNDHSEKIKGPALPDHPGDKPLQHVALKWLEQAEAKLAGKQLLSTANGILSAAVNRIRIDPIDVLYPRLPEEHKYYEKRMEDRRKAQYNNDAKVQERHDQQMAEWDAVYSAIVECTETTAVALNRRIVESCDLAQRNVAGGHYDGPLAWRMAVAALAITVCRV